VSYSVTGKGVQYMRKKGDKISIIGAGNVGAMVAQRILEHDLADVVLLDIERGRCQGKVGDLCDAAPIMGYEKEVIGTSDYSMIRGSNIVVVTAGYPRTPGMSREDLLRKNASIIRDVSLKIKEYEPGAIVIIITNPLDLMTYLTYKTTGFQRTKVLGMAGTLDSARFSNLAARELNITSTEIESIVIGSHDTRMVPLLGHSKAQGKPLQEIFSPEKQRSLVEDTRNRGAYIVQLLKSGSAFFAPSAACFTMIKAILHNEHAILPVSVYLEGEYGFNDVCIGIPISLGKSGMEQIVELQLTDEETGQLNEAVEQLKKNIPSLTL